MAPVQIARGMATSGANGIFNLTQFADTVEVPRAVFCELLLTGGRYRFTPAAARVAFAFRCFVGKEIYGNDSSPFAAQWSAGGSHRRAAHRLHDHRPVHRRAEGEQD